MSTTSDTAKPRRRAVAGLALAFCAGSLTACKSAPNPVFTPEPTVSPAPRSDAPGSDAPSQTASSPPAAATDASSTAASPGKLVTLADGYQYAVSVTRAPSLVTSETHDGTPLNAPPGRDFLEVQLLISNPTDRPEPMYSLTNPLMPLAQYGGPVYFAVPMADGTAFGLSDCGTTDVTVQLPAGLCVINTQTSSVVGPGAVGVDSDQLQAGTAVSAVDFADVQIPISTAESELSDVTVYAGDKGDAVPLYTGP